ncbi:GlcNAc-PI de-N-acetylase [Chloroflexia bacterium SDU3-3]|nr:GlcNAc-PI de-N-acetylase [Chloroflexia bacterium SDU3-3]
MLIVYAHPDDESFGNAGTIARYTSAGVDVHYACATRGECGEMDPKLLEGYADIAARRTAELRAAAEAIQLSSIHFLGYRDSGMQGSEANQHPLAYCNADIQRAAGQVVGLIRALRPQVVLTFNPYGGYGHPDHIMAHRATVAAFQAAANPTLYPEQVATGLEPWQPQKLYYSTFGAGFIRAAIRIMPLFGRDPRRFGTNQDVDLTKIAGEITPTTTRVNSAAFLAQKEKAWDAHASQTSGRGVLGRLPAPVRSQIYAGESFTRVVPAWAGGPRERDLFAGVNA